MLVASIAAHLDASFAQSATQSPFAGPSSKIVFDLDVRQKSPVPQSSSTVHGAASMFGRRPSAPASMMIGGTVPCPLQMHAPKRYPSSWHI
jgi:hypothetical protein